jgi:hypothetical protein
MVPLASIYSGLIIIIIIIIIISSSSSSSSIIVVVVTPCGSGLKYLHRSPVSRRK